MNKYIMFTDMVGYSKLTGDDKNLDLALSLLQDADCQLFITSLENLEKYKFDFVIDL